MRVLAKVLVFPLVIVLSLAGLAVRVAIKLGSVVAGICTLIFGILAVLVLINKMWLLNYSCNRFIEKCIRREQYSLKGRLILMSAFYI